LKHPELAGRVVAWQRQFGRHGLPWQASREPYRVWLSEVMLQQTQVSTVLDYYPRFLQRFPTVQALAAASLDDVFGLWSGLGYYSRARNLHRCAQTVVNEHGGEFPGNSAALAELPGIGRSTAAAIAAFCFGERAAILDGNVKRVLSRVLGFNGDLMRASESNRLWALAEGLLPARDVDIYTQGLMDLGATVCLARKPACESCPLNEDCVAKAQGEPQRYPEKIKKLKRSRRSHALLWLQQGAQVFLVQREPRGVWAGLFSLPEFESVEALNAFTAAWPGRGEWLQPIEHVLTHFDWTLTTLNWQLPEAAQEPAASAASAASCPAGQLSGLPTGRWMPLAEALNLGLPAPVRKLLAREADLFS
jgi:A/G-specific adenine glycosylase